MYILWQKCLVIVGQQGEGRGVAQLEAFSGKNRQQWDILIWLKTVLCQWASESKQYSDILAFFWPRFENGKLPSAMCSTFTFHVHFSHWHAAQKKESLTRKSSVSLLTNLVRCVLLRFLPSCKNSLKLFMALCHFSCHEGRHERKLWWNLGELLYVGETWMIQFQYFSQMFWTPS